MQRITVLLIFLSTLISCGEKKGKLLVPDSLRYSDQDVPLEELQSGNVNTDSIVILDKMKSEFLPADSLIEGRPASYYLNRGDISATARNFYLLTFIPSDDDRTYALCDSILTKNDTTRPFYFFLFVRLMKISDGALAEELSQYARPYVLQYPDDFFKRIDEPVYKQYYDDWVSNVAYDFIIPKIETPTSDDIRSYIISEQLKHLKHITPALRSRIESFAADVAKQE